VQHSEVLKCPEVEATRIAEFVGSGLNVASMARQVEQSLYREKVGASVATS